MATNKIKKKEKKILLTEYFAFLIKRKCEAGRNSTADLYRATNNWLAKFKKGRIPMLRDITPVFVDDFYLYLQSDKHLKTNSIISYMSNFRAMYNTAVRERIIHPHINPFSHLSLRKEETSKRAVSKDVMEDICKLDLKEEPELALSADLCLFSFQACGIPFVDLANLTNQNIIGNDIVYNRKKTGTQIRITITEGMKYFLNKYKGQNGDYLFPILKNGSATRHEEYKSILYKYNTNLKEIGTKIGIPIKLTSYVIRHTWATVAYKNHIPIAIISQALGHTSEKTTRYYLAQLDQSELSNANQLVTGFIESILMKRA